MSMRGYWTILGCVVLAGCAHTVDVRYPEAEVNRALLASVGARRVTIESVADQRPDPTRIGVDPKSKKPLVSRRPVADIVHEALVVELQRNGHTIVPDRDDLVLTAEVEDFSLDVVIGHPRTQYVGKVALAIAINDARSGQLLLARRYVALKRRTADRDARDAGRDVMNAALTRTMHDLATDPELARAFAGRHPGVTTVEPRGQIRGGGLGLLAQRSGEDPQFCIGGTANWGDTGGTPA
jgi:uncharacterized lipoprotein YajG